MAQLYIVRHGNTFDKGDTVTRVGARTDLALSASGREQAQALGRHFRQEGIAFSSAIAGPLRRTRQTADAIAAEQAGGLDVTIEEFLREIDYGPDENRPEPEVVERIGQPALDAWEYEAVPPPGWTVDPEALVRDWQKLFAAAAKAGNDAPILVVTSNGVARFSLLAARRQNPAAGAGDHDLKLKTGAYGILDIGPDGDAQVTRWNVRP